MELLLSIIAFRGAVGWLGCVSTNVLDERLSSRTSCAVTLTKGKRVPFYYTKPVSLKPVRKVICLNEFASSLFIAFLSASVPLSSGLHFWFTIKRQLPPSRKNLNENIFLGTATQLLASFRENTLLILCINYNIRLFSPVFFSNFIMLSHGTWLYLTIVNDVKTFYGKQI